MKKVFIFSTIFIFLLTKNALTSCPCQRDIEKKYARYNTSCAPVVNVMLSIAKNYNEMKDNYESAREARTELTSKIKSLTKGLDQIKKEYDKLYTEAAKNGLLLRKDLAKVAYGGGAKKGVGIFGIPLSAYTFNPVEIAAINKIAQKEKELTLKWDKERDHVIETTKKLIDEFNKEIAIQKRKLINQWKTISRLKEDLVEMFMSGKFEHCLGKPDEDRIEKLPTIKPWLPPLKKMLPAYRPFPELPDPPTGIAALPRIPMKMDGRFALKQYISLLKNQMETESIYTRIKVMTGFYILTKAVRDVTAGFVKGIAYELPKSLVTPLGNLVDSKQGWIEAMGNTALGYGKVAKQLTVDQVVQVGKDICELTKSMADMMANIANQIPKTSKDVEQTFQSLQSFYSRSKAFVSYLMKELQRAQGLKPKTYKEQLKYAKDLEKVVDGYKKLNNTIDKAVGAENKYLVQNIPRIFNIALSAEMLKAGKSYAGKVSNSLKKTIETVSEKSTILRNKIDEASAVSYTRSVKQVRRIPEKGAETKVADISEIASKMKEGKISELTKTQIREAPAPKKEIKLTKTQTKKTSSSETASVEAGLTENIKEFSIQTSKGTKKIKAAYVAEGTMKAVYKYTENGKTYVIKVFKGNFDISGELKRMGMTAYRLKKAGLSYPRYKIVRLKDGTKAIIEEAFNPKTVAENIIKNNKWTNAHAEALLSYMKRLNENGYVVTDPNIGNFRFYKKNGKLVCELLDLDGVVSVKEVAKKLKEEKGSTEIAGIGDLKDPSTIAELQKGFLFGFDQQKIIFNMNMFMGFLSSELATSKYGIKTQMGYQLPVSQGSFKAAFEKAGKSDLLKAMLKAFDQNWKGIGEAKFFKELAKEEDVYAKFVEETDSKLTEEKSLRGLDLSSIESGLNEAMQDLPKIDDLKNFDLKNLELPQ